MYVYHNFAKYYSIQGVCLGAEASAKDGRAWYRLAARELYVYLNGEKANTHNRSWNRHALMYLKTLMLSSNDDTKNLRTHHSWKLSLLRCLCVEIKTKHTQHNIKHVIIIQLYCHNDIYLLWPLYNCYYYYTMYIIMYYDTTRHQTQEHNTWKHRTLRSSLWA